MHITRIHFQRLILTLLISGFFIVHASPAWAACTWKFDWYCSDCARIGGRTTGEQGGYASEAACESARSSAHRKVTTMSCERIGWCDEPQTCQSSPGSEIRRNDGISKSASPQSNHEYQRRLYEETLRRKEEREKREAERKARERRKFEQAKTEAFNQLKGSRPIKSGGIGGLKVGRGSGELTLKSSTCTLGADNCAPFKLKTYNAEKSRAKSGSGFDSRGELRIKKKSQEPPSLKGAEVPTPQTAHADLAPPTKRTDQAYLEAVTHIGSAPRRIADLEQKQRSIAKQVTNNEISEAQGKRRFGELEKRKVEIELKTVAAESTIKKETKRYKKYGIDLPKPE